MNISIEELLQLAEHIKKEQTIKVDGSAITIRVKVGAEDKLLKPIKIQGDMGKEILITELGVYHGEGQTKYWIVKD